MVRRFIDAVFLRSPLILSLGGAALTWNHVHHYLLSEWHVIEAFLLVWLGYRAFQNVESHFFRTERVAALTALFTCFYFSGFPVAILFAAALVFAYQMNNRWSVRRIPIVKNIAIATAWSCCTTSLLFAPSFHIAFLFAADWCLVFGLSLLSDLRDEHEDLGELRTAVHVFGRWPIAICSLGAIASYYIFQMSAKEDFYLTTYLVLVIAGTASWALWASHFKSARLATVSIDFSLVVFSLVATYA
jgi:hypothetical protein